MIQVEPKTSRSSRGRRPWPRGSLLGVLALALALASVGPARAGDGTWSFELEAVAMDAYGHDQHVLTVRDVDSTASPRSDSKRAVTLDTSSGLGYRGELQYRRPKWGYGLDFFWFSTSQRTPDLSASGSGPASPMVFEIADQSFTSTTPGQELFYSVLEDTDVAVWNVDLYALRTLAERSGSALRLQLGIRLADFDNDYRAVAGVRGVGGTRIDASSNYGLMMGPLVGLAGEIQLGKSTIGAYLGQSVVLGNPELSNMSRGFTGTFDPSETATFFDRELFRADRDVAIPITELRLEWSYAVTKHIVLGLGANGSTWWDVPVPPGVIPVPGGDQTLHENTIVFYGLTGSVGVTF